MDPLIQVVECTRGWAQHAVASLNMLPVARSSIGAYWVKFASWLGQPRVVSVLIAWSATFTVVYTGVSCLGFGRGRGGAIKAGTLATAFQSYMYGAFTPAGGLFATLTCMGMLGTLQPAVCLFSSVVATLVATRVWASER